MDIKDIINVLGALFLENYYNNEIRDMEITFSNISASEELANNLKSILQILENIPLKKRHLPSLCYESLYKLKKKQLHALVRFSFFEK